jgi:TPP-dependent pyruvate/acetoin dehydrogenase alpha subunit
MATGTATEGAYENPLIPNARLRQIYLAMMRARAVEKTLASHRSRRGVGTLGLEACLVSTSVDLTPGDVVSDAVAGSAVEFLRGATLESVLRPDAVSRKRGLHADCGAAGRLAAVPGSAERLWVALGAAAALQATRKNIGTESERQAGVAVVYVRLGEVAPALWRKVLGFAGEKQLPVLFVVLPARRGAKPAKAGVMSAIALRHGVPGMAVDADDAVAIYRVAQEAIGRARIGGGAALLECVPWVIEGAKAKRHDHADAIAGLEQYMLSRGVVTKRWIERETKSFADRIAR